MNISNLYMCIDKSHTCDIFQFEYLVIFDKYFINPIQLTVLRKINKYWAFLMTYLTK